MDRRRKTVGRVIDRGLRSGKAKAIAGLTAGIVLYLVGFIAIGGEWFAMWQSQTWNRQNKSFQLVAVFALVLLILLAPDGHEDTSR